MSEPFSVKTHPRLKIHEILIAKSLAGEALPNAWRSEYVQPVATSTAGTMPWKAME
jgi:hypothetical protein